MLMLLTQMTESANTSDPQSINWGLVVLAVVTGIFGLIGTVFGFIQHMSNKKVETKKNASDHSIQLLEQLSLRVGNLETKVSTLEREKDDLAKEKTALNKIIDKLQGSVHDYEELIKDFVGYTEAIIHWYENGAEGQFPNRTWRIDSAMKHRYSAVTTAISKEDEDA